MRVRLDVTDRNGRLIERLLLTSKLDVDFSAEIDAAYADFKTKYGAENIYIFHNTLPQRAAS